MKAASGFYAQTDLKVGRSHHRLDLAGRERTDWMAAASENPDRRSVRRARRVRPSHPGCSRIRLWSSGRAAFRKVGRPSEWESPDAKARKFQAGKANSMDELLISTGPAQYCARPSRPCRRLHW